MNYRKLSLVLAPLLFSSLSVISQAVDVDLASGSGYVTIPLYTATERSISLPIYLTNATSGVRVKQADGVVGLGWSLNVNGGISRQVMGIPDDFSSSTISGWLSGQTALNIQNFNVGTSGTCNESSQWTTINAYNYKVDTEPDIFYINLPTVSGEFIFDQNKNVRFLTHNDAKVTANYTSGKISSFTVVDANGTIYTLGTTSTETKYSGNNLPELYKKEHKQYLVPITYNTAWHPSQISSITGDVINFTYEELQFSNNVFISNPIKVQGEFTDKTHDVFYNGQLASTLYDSIAQTQFVVTGISGSTFSLTMEYSTRIDEGGQFLDEIVIVKDNISNTIDLQYELYSNIHFSEKRMFLKKVLSTTTKGGNSYTTPPIELDYYHADAGETIMPPMSSPNYDFWGYYNGSSDGRSYPRMYVYPSLSGEDRFRLHKLSSGYTGSEYILDGNNREMNLAAAVTGSIKKITLPSGGTHFLFYESNTYVDNISGETRKGGGLRVKKWIIHDGVESSNDIITTYTYGTGNALYLPKYHITSARNGTTTYDELSGTNLFNQLLVRTDRDISPDVIGGRGILYSQVTVSKNGFGKSIYYFDASGYFPQTTANGDWEASSVKMARKNTGITDVCYKPGLHSLGYFAYPFPINPNYSFHQGLLTKEEHYNSNNNLLTKTEYEYIPLNPNSANIVYSLPYQEVNTYYGSGSGKVYSTMFLFTKVPIQTGKGYFIEKVKNTTHDPNNLTQAIIDEQNFEYGTNHAHPLTISIVNSDGVTYFTKNKYVKDYPISGTLNVNVTALKNLKDQNINLLIERVSERKEVGLTAKVTGASVTLYKTVENGKVIPEKSFVVNKYLNSFTPSSISLGATKQFVYDANYVKVVDYLSYDYYGNILSSVGRDKIETTTLLGNNDRFPVLSASHAKAEEILFSDATQRGFLLETNTSRTLHTTASYTGENAVPLAVDNIGSTYLKGLIYAKENKYLLSFWKNTITPVITVKIYNSGYTTLFKTITLNNPSSSTGWKKVRQVIDLTGYTNQLLGIRIIPHGDVILDDVLLIPQNSIYSTTSFDATGRITSVTDPNMRTIFYMYDTAGRLLWVKDQDQNIVNFNEYGTR